MALKAPWEEAVLAALVRDNAMRETLEAGVRAAWFVDFEERQIFEQLHEHWKLHGRVPSERKFRLMFPDEKLIDLEDPLSSVLADAVLSRKKLVLSNAIAEAAQLIDEDAPEEADAALRDARHKLDRELSQGRDRELVADVDQRLARYREIAATGTEINGIRTGFPTIDKATGGLQPGGVTLLIATPKAGKSFLTLRAAMMAHAKGLRPLFLTYEMTTVEQAERHDSMLSSVNHTALTRGTMRDQDWDKLRTSMTDFAEREREFHVPDMSDVAQRNVSGILAKIEKYNPDVVFIDGLYFLHPESAGLYQGSPAALTEVSRSLKQLALRTNLPFFATTQALLSKTGGKKGRRLHSDSVGYTSAFLQDCDVMLGLEKEDPDDDDNHFRVLRVLESRHCGQVTSSLEFNWDNMTFLEVDRDSASSDAVTHFAPPSKIGRGRVTRG